MDKFKSQFLDIIKKETPNKIFFVCSKEYDRFGYRQLLEQNSFSVVSFTEFTPCPEMADAKKGTQLFLDSGCDFIVTVGGGSPIDTAKAIKLFSEKDVKILAVPTTAGTGAEVTKTSVLYINGDKQSVKSKSIIPEYAVFDYTTLSTLPRNQKIYTSLDAFCHSIEAYISLNATDESRDYSTRSLKLFNLGFDGYINNDTNYEIMMECSHLAGEAINIASTVSAHAFSYKLHKIKGFAHGKACAVCLAYIWQYMLNFGDESVRSLLFDVEKISSFNPQKLISLLNELGLLDDLVVSKAEFDEIVNGVNIPRLANNPMAFEGSDIKNIYSKFLIIK